jgi:hypothetical protein
MTKFIASIVARKKLLVLLIGLWLVAATAGYFVGTRDNERRLSNPVVYDHTDMREDDAKVFLVYRCNNKDFTWYDIKNGQVQDFRTKAALVPTESFIYKVGGFATTVLGPGSAFAAWVNAYAERATKSFGGSGRARTSRRLVFFAEVAGGAVVAVTYAAVSGMYGYVISDRHVPVCNDAELAREVGQAAFWKPVAETYVKQLWKQAHDLAHQIEMSPDRRAVLDGALARVEEDPADSNSLITLRHELGDKYRKPEYFVALWTPVHFLMFTAGMIFITVLLGYFLPALSEIPGSAKKPRKSKRQLKD